MEHNLNQDQMLKARKLAFFISIFKKSVFLLFDFALIGVFFMVAGIDVLTGVFGLLVGFFKLHSFFKGIGKIKLEVGLT